jgi:HAD superfamily hydrolase (TIGR01509 family)
MKQRYTMEIVASKRKPRFVHEYALSRLCAEGYRLAVASNSIRSTIETMMRQAELAQYLEFTVSNEDVAKAKPDPEMYNLAVARLALSPTEVLIVEDNENGLRAARASGAHVLQVQHVEDVNYANISRRIAECNALADVRAAG